MSATNEFYRTREASERRTAAAATLDNVRDLHLTAAAAWEALALRGERTERRRAETEARKASEALMAGAELTAADDAPQA